VPLNFVDGLDGCRIAFKAYVQPNGNMYRNYRCQCPTHGDCFKVKGETKPLLQKYGALGPVIYLHAWISAQPAGDKPHNLCEPSSAAVEEYAANHTDALQDVMARAQAAAV